MRSKQAGRVEALEESEVILETAVTVQQEVDVVRTTWSVRGTMAGLRYKGKGQPPERVVVPSEDEGGLRSRGQTATAMKEPPPLPGPVHDRNFLGRQGVGVPGRGGGTNLTVSFAEAGPESCGRTRPEASAEDAVTQTRRLAQHP